ncbi:sterile alpha motif domain-containing protein 9-like [Mugil cephalus]|uniref:sterile alpha motif domain-containing protein 9-like n=1 Tax=Mugil cephalus TaxID=48193 RepID=UPI001FB81943|nr:sterile alpha motif domain-containing protein 9-like [Mugil cephalus]
MANGPALSTVDGGEIYVGRTFRDSFSSLDVLHANEFEGELYDPNFVEERQANFYRGAPPNWLNFHFSEQAASNGTGTPFIKRDGYQALKEEIQEKAKFPGISAVKLFHQPGCGGTTTAMHVLWDLRKTLRCAVLRGSAPDITNVAKDVVLLFTAGNQGHQNTVLLLLDDEQILDDLQHSIMMMITAQQKLVTYRPVVVLLSCVRKDAVLESDHVVLQKVLSDKEKQQFNEKKEELSRRYGERCKLFHGFNILQTNFSQDYIEKACEIFITIRKTNKPLKTQLAAFLSLLNAYVPGSYLLESQCRDFLKHHDNIDRYLSLEHLMKPFTHLIVTFQQDIRSERIVRMVHPLIAQCCIDMMDKAGVTRSDTARNFLTCFCKDEVPPWLLGFVKDMLTKRVMKKEENPNIKEDKERFSRLILDIQKMEGEPQSASVLKMASKRFDQNAFFPQALARFYYIELKDYNLAETWAKTAKQRDPQSSFVADTLGQVHKNHLNNNAPSTQLEILQLAEKAIAAFKHEEELAEKEAEVKLNNDHQTKVSHLYNSRGQFGYLQVCNALYDKLVEENITWREVLTKKVSMISVLESLGHKKLYRFNTLINSLRDEVERKCDFFDKYLTYSKLSMEKEDPEYITRDTLDCYRNYVGESPPTREGAVGVLSCLDREYTKSELKEIITRYGEICSSKDSGTALNFPLKCRLPKGFGEKMPMSPKDPPEQHMLALLLYWPDKEEKCTFDLNQLIQQMHQSYEHTYKKYFCSRYLRPLFFIGKGPDQNLIVHRKVLEQLCEQSQKTVPDWSNTWKNEHIFKNPRVQEHLLTVEGVVRNYRVYATVGDTEIEVNVNLQNSLWKPRQVFFYLGFTIRGPVAFRIQTKN